MLEGFAGHPTTPDPPSEGSGGGKVPPQYALSTKLWLSSMPEIVYLAIWCTIYWWARQPNIHGLVDKGNMVDDLSTVLGAHDTLAVLLECLKSICPAGNAMVQDVSACLVTMGVRDGGVV